MLFKDKDVICFFGDSITAHDDYVSEIYQTIKEKANVKCYNCGVPGGSCNKAIHYIYEKCLCFNPDYVVTFFGINDLCHWLHTKESYTEQAKETIKASIEEHKKTYCEIIEAIQKFGAEVILCVPTPYDEIGKHPSECAYIHVQEDLDIISDYVSELAEKYGCRVIDYRKVFMPLLKEKPLFNDDRVHPTLLGQHVIAQTFLKETGVIDKVDYDTPFVMNEWIAKRHAAFAPYCSLCYVEYCDIYTLSLENHWNAEQKKAEVARRLEKPSGVQNAYRLYLEKIDYLPEIFSEIIKYSY